MALRALLLAAPLLIAGSAGAIAADCDASIAPVDGPDGYRPRAGERCEGLFVSPVGGTAVDLVSLTAGRLYWNGQQPGILKLTLAAPPPFPDRPIRLQASGIPSGLYYRMDADIAPGTPVFWPVGDVVAHESITPDQIGVLAFQLDQSGRPVYLPVQVSPSATETIAVLRVLGLIDSPQWRFVLPGQPNAALQPASLQQERIEIPLGPAEPPRSGMLEIHWNDTSTGEARTVRMSIGG